MIHGFNQNYKMLIHVNYKLIIIIVGRTRSTGVTERMTFLLSTHVEIYKDASWLNDDALRSGVVVSLSRYRQVS